MNEATRRQVLADLGIDVWRLRVSGTTDAVPAASRREAPVALAPVPAASPPAAAATLPSRAASPARTRARPSPGPVDQVAIAVQSIAAPGVLLLVSGTLGRRDRRLVLDLLGAATGDWQHKPVLRVFQWPPELPTDAPGTGGSAERALRAFVDKDLVDHGVTALIHTADLAALLPGPEAWPGCRRHVVESLSALGQDPAGKRALWQFLSAAGR